MFSFHFNCAHVWSAMIKVFGACNIPSKLDFTKTAAIKFNNAQNYTK